MSSSENGRITITHIGEDFSFGWEGGPVALVSDAFKATAISGFIESLGGGLYRYGPFTVRLIGRDELRSCDIVERIGGY